MRRNPDGSVDLNSSIPPTGRDLVHVCTVEVIGHDADVLDVAITTRCGWRVMTTWRPDFEDEAPDANCRQCRTKLLPSVLKGVEEAVEAGERAAR